MSHYEKLAIIAIRLAAVAFFGMGIATFLFGGVIGGLYGNIGGFTAMRLAAFIPSLFYLAIGTVLYGASRSIARLITRDLE